MNPPLQTRKKRSPPFLKTLPRCSPTVEGWSPPQQSPSNPPAPGEEFGLIGQEKDQERQRQFLIDIPRGLAGKGVAWMQARAHTWGSPRTPHPCWKGRGGTWGDIRRSECARRVQPSSSAGISAVTSGRGS